MKKKPIKIRLLGKENSQYKLKFPYLKVPVVVNEYFFNKMQQSDIYQF